MLLASPLHHGHAVDNNGPVIPEIYERIRKQFNSADDNECPTQELSHLQKKLSLVVEMV
jgi:hypothetical protein